MFSSSQRRGRRFRPVLDTLPGRIAPTVFLPPPPTSIDPGPLPWRSDTDAGHLGGCRIAAGDAGPTDACMVDGLLLC